MAGYQGCISLALLCLWLCHHSLTVDSEPCQPNTKNNKNEKAYTTFLANHVPKGTQFLLSTNQWLDFITKADLVRPKQSFLSPDDEQGVMDVCSATGGRRYKDNMCISLKTFTFTVVEYDENTKDVTSVKPYTKHLILGCDIVNGQCRPVHFQPNYNETSDAYELPCESSTTPPG